MANHDELRAAAERLRRVKAGEGLRAVYDDYGDMPGRELDKWTLDRAVVADAYLARKPLTHERVAAAVGELFGGQDVEVKVYGRDSQYLNGWRIRPLTDRLCRLLGVEG